MRILNSCAFWGILIASVFVYMLMMGTAPANATRIPVNAPDVCFNILGTQTADQTAGYRAVYRIKDNGRCVRRDGDRCFDIPSIQSWDRKGIDWRFQVKTVEHHDCRLIPGMR